MKLFQRLLWSRYGWFLQGLPDVDRAVAMMKIRHNTMTTTARSKALWKFCKMVFEEDIPGDFVECGVWKGGSSGLMALAQKKFEINGTRKIHLFDSFEGLPQPGHEDGERAADYSGGVSAGELISVHQCEAGLDEVRAFLLGKLQIPRNRLVFHKGWFQNSLPDLGPEPGQIALLRLDGDWYGSTKVCLDYLYDRVPIGGIIILDDYFCWEGCKKATDEFRIARGIDDEIIRIDVDAGYWIKNN